MYEVRTRQVPGYQVVTEQRTVDQAELLGWLPGPQGAMARVVTAAEKLGGVVRTPAAPHLLRPAGADEPVVIVIYGGNPNEGPVPVEVCAPVPTPEVEPIDVPVRQLPGCREAYVRVTKEIVETGRLGSVYAAVEEWLGAHGLEVADAPRETYWADFGKAGPTDEVFDVSFPYQ